MTLEEMKGKVISEAEGKFKVAKEDLEIVYDEFSIPACIVENEGGFMQGGLIFDALAEEYYKSESEEKLSKFLSDRYAKMIIDKIKARDEDASKILEEIKIKLDPRTIEDVYRGKLFEISEYMINSQEKIFDGNREEIWKIVNESMSFDNKKEYRGAVSDEAYKKLVKAIVSKDKDYGKEEKEYLMELIEKNDLETLMNKEKARQSCPELENYVDYFLNDVNHKISFAIEKFDYNISKEVPYDLIPIIDDILKRSHVVAENMKNLCGEIKEKVDEVPAIDEE